MIMGIASFPPKQLDKPRRFKGSSMRVAKPKTSPPSSCFACLSWPKPKEREAGPQKLLILLTREVLMLRALLKEHPFHGQVDVILIGAGVMSATVGVMLKEHCLESPCLVPNSRCSPVSCRSWSRTGR